MRADSYLNSLGYTKSRSSAKQLIESGGVTVDGKTVIKPSEEIDESVNHLVNITNSCKFVGRGGLKLEAALDAFEVDVTGLTALDIGASTGGFTDCLLKRGAAHVTAVDSGCGQLDPCLAADCRVTNIEKYNARELSKSIIPDGADLVVIDVSFISQTLILPCIPQVLRSGGRLISLIKPQFEAGRQAVGKGGVVKSGKFRLMSVLRVKDAAAQHSLFMRKLIVSPITGGDGNLEYLALFETDTGKTPLDENTIRRIVL